MRRKTLIVIALVFIMLFSSILPTISAYAAEEGEPAAAEMTFNTDLYKGLKAYFQEQRISAAYNDVEHTITMSASVLNSIESISLKEKGISNISGLQYFTNVKSLILSSNDLSEKSNLSVLNDLANLEYLDLSSNSIKDATDIEPLVMRLLSVDSNAVNLSSQAVKAVVDVENDIEEEVLTREFTLPQILQLAGIAKNGSIDNKGYLKAEWFTQARIGSNDNSDDPLIRDSLAPYIVGGSIPNPVTADDNTFKIQVGYENARGYVPYQGLIKLVITIKDINPDLDNPAAQNLLKDSVFTLFFVVHLENSEAAIIKDRNLYYAIKEQLEAEQLINPDLMSYKYGVENGETAYDVCTYTVAGTTATLSYGGRNMYTIPNFNNLGGEGIVNNLITGESYVLKYEVVDIPSVSASGSVTLRRHVKVPHVNNDCDTLYVDAYDEALSFVIYDVNMVNKITSLILNDKRIYDLSGIEKFVGLSSNLNVSYNYIDTLADIYALQKNKEAVNGSLQETFNAKKAAMKTKKDKVESAYKELKNIKKSIEDEARSLEQKIDEYKALPAPTAEQTTAINNAVNEYNAKFAAPDGDYYKKLEEALYSSDKGLNTFLPDVYDRLEVMYGIYNNEYKLTTILTPALNYQTEEDYEKFKEENSTLAGAKKLVKDEVSRISTLEKAGALSELEKDLISIGFDDLVLPGDQEFPISFALNEKLKDMEEVGARRSEYAVMNSTFIEIGIYSAATNYCLLKRMNNDTAEAQCYVAEYLDKTIQEYTYEDIDTKLLEAINKKVKTGVGSTGIYTDDLNIAFTNYIAKTLTYSGTAFNVCKGPYYPVEEVEYDVSDKTYRGFTYSGTFKYNETVDSKTSDNILFFFEQLMNLANKFTAIDETSLYVNVPALKRIDVRNNEIETIGETELTMVDKDGVETTTTETLASLPNLKEFYAGHNLVTGDIACVDWTTLTSLKNLDLSYNFLRDISPLQVLENLRYLDVSDNLLDGSFNLILRKMPKLKELKLAGNKYSDIDQIINDFEMVSGGDFTGYFAREDTLNLDLSRQRLEINIEEPIVYDENKVTGEVELPRIFAQLERIDATRTAFGTTSSKGSVQARGGKAYIPVSEVGDYTATVKVIAANGYPEEVTTSVGINTICTITYKVVAGGSSPVRPDPTKTVTSVTITTDKNTVAPGGIVNAAATVTGTNLTEADKAVTWSVSGNAKTGTTISNSGVLTVASDETSTRIKITAASVLDTNVKAEKYITVSSSGAPSSEPSYGYAVSSDGSEIIGISPDTSLSNFKTKLLNDNSYTVEVKRNGTALTSDQKVATSDIVVITKDGSVIATYELVVKGDVNGDGVADAADSSLIKAHRAAITSLSGAYLDAADINNDGSVDIMDIRLLLYHRARIEGYIL